MSKNVRDRKKIILEQRKLKQQNDNRKRIGMYNQVRYIGVIILTTTIVGAAVMILGLIKKYLDSN